MLSNALLTQLMVSAILVISLQFGVTICIFITAKEFAQRFTM